jgi:thioredoxin 2
VTAELRTLVPPIYDHEMATFPLDDKGLIVSCNSCGKQNRLTWDSLGRTHRCGRCKAELSSVSSPVDVPSDALFDAIVASSAVPVVVDYWAPWCGPCRMVAPELEKVAQKNAGRLLVIKVNTDEVPELGARYSIRSIPTMAVFSRGREVGRTSGARPAAAIEAFVNQSVAGR